MELSPAPATTARHIRSITVQLREKRPQSADHLSYLRHLVFKCSKVSLQSLLQSHYRSMVFEGPENRSPAEGAPVRRYRAEETDPSGRIERLVNTGACVLTPVAGQKSPRAIRAADATVVDRREAGPKAPPPGDEKSAPKPATTASRPRGTRARSCSADGKRKALTSSRGGKSETKTQKPETSSLLRSSVPPSREAAGHRSKSSAERVPRTSRSLSDNVIFKKPIEPPQAVADTVQKSLQTPFVLPQSSIADTVQRSLSVIQETPYIFLLPSTPEVLESVPASPVESFTLLTVTPENRLQPAEPDSPTMGKLTIRRTRSVLENGFRSIRKRLPSFYYARRAEEDEWSPFRETSASLARHDRNLQKIRALRVIEQFGGIPSPERISVDRTVHETYRDNWASILRIKFVADHWVPSAYVHEHYSKFHKPPFQSNGIVDDKKITQSITIVLKLSKTVIQDE